jgi:Integrase core domain
VFDYIEAFYNPIRLHSIVDYLSPVEYEKMQKRESRKKAALSTVSTEPGTVHSLE